MLTAGFGGATGDAGRPIRMRVGRLTLDEVRDRLRRGQTPQPVADAAGLARQTLVNRLNCRGLRLVRVWDIAPIDPDADEENPGRTGRP